MSSDSKGCSGEVPLPRLIDSRRAWRRQLEVVWVGENDK